MKKIALIIGILFLLAGPAFATVWTADFTPEPSPLYMADGDQQVMNFDIRAAGFDNGLWGGDNVEWWKVEVYAIDDYLVPPYSIIDAADLRSSGLEYMTLSTGYLHWDPQAYEVDTLRREIYGNNLAGEIALEVFGWLRINLEATGGDFMLYGATLTASDTAPVPEPATMLLLGTGLLGLVAFGRKRFKK